MVSPKKLWVCYVNKAALPAKTIKKQLVSLEEKLGLCRKKKSIYRLIGGLSGENEYIKKEIENILGDN